MLYLARHGRTPANAQGLLQGRMDLSLDDTGRLQAQRIAAVVRHADLIISSPLRRARETAEAIGKPILIDERWIELDFGMYDGLSRHQIPTAIWEKLRTDVSFAPDGGESLAQMRERVSPALQEGLELARDPQRGDRQSRHADQGVTRASARCRG